MRKRFLIFLLFTLGLGLVWHQAMASPAPLPERTQAETIQGLSAWILGDSLTMGLFASTEETTFRNLLFHDLQAFHAARLNMTFWQSVCTLGGLQKRWEELDGKPDILFIEVGINDLGSTSSYKYCIYTPIDIWQASYGAMLDRIRSDVPNARIIVGTIPWCGWEEDNPFYALAQQYNAWIIEEAEKRHIPVADLWSATVGKADGISRPDQPSFFPPYHGDNFHPNDLGHQRLAQTFFQTYLSQMPKTYLPLYVGAAQDF